MRAVRFQVAIVSTWLVIGASLPVFGQQVPTDPASTHIFPAGGRRGTIVPVRVGGECLSPYTRFTLIGDGLAAEPELVEKVDGPWEPSPRRKPDETPIYYPREWKSAITIAADAPLGQKLWRTSSARGGTGARPFIVGDLPEFIETESNSTPEKAEAIALPVTVNGQIAGERDLDYYRFSVQANEVVTIDVAVARLGSTLEPIVELYEPNGRRMPAEEFRVGSDSVWAIRIPTTGEYRLLISNLSFRGGPQYVYRLTLSTAPWVRYAFPPGAISNANQATELFSLAGPDGKASWAEQVKFPAGSPSRFELKGRQPLANTVWLETSDLPVLVEAEPNDQPPAATPVAGSATIYGRFQAAGDDDYYAVSLTPDQPITLECTAMPAGTGLLPVLSISDSGGAVLATVNAAERSPWTCRLDWRPPTAGTYTIRLRDMRRQSEVAGAPYRLTIRPMHADFALTASTDVANVVQGNRGEIELKIDRQGGFAAPIDLTMEGLPSGVRAEPLQIPANVEVFRLAFIAEAETQPGDSPIKITGTAKAGDEMLTHQAQAWHLGHDADGISLGSPTADHLQLTIRHKPVFRLYCNEAYQYAYRGTVYPYLMEVERLDGFDGPIELEVADRQIKDLDGIEVVRSQIPAGQSQLMLPLYLPEDMHINVQAHSNVYAQGFVVFQDKWGRRQSMTQISEMRCMVRPLPTVAKLRVVEKAIEVRPGQITCTLQLDRTSNFAGEFRVELQSPCVEITMAPVYFAGGETQRTATLSVREDFAPGNLSQLIFRGTGELSGGVQVVSRASVPVTP